MPPQSTAASAPRPRADRRVLLAGHLVGVVALLFYFHTFIGRYIDDAFITLSYSTTLARHGVWGMHADLTSNAATSPLNVILLALLIKIVRDPLIALWLFNVLTAILIFASLRHFSLRIFATEHFAFLATALLLVNPILNSTQGLESYLLVGLVLLACQLWDRQSFRALGLTLGALALTRPDALALSAVFLAALLLRRQRRNAFIVAAFALVPVIPWLVFSWSHLGSLFPDTLLIKLTESSWENQTFLTGLLSVYWLKFPTATALSIALAPALFYLRRSAIANPARHSLLLGLGAYAIIHFLAYAFILHVPPYHWYYAVELAAIAILATLVLCEATASYRATNLALLIALIVVSATFIVKKVSSSQEAIVATNFATPGEYKSIAQEINARVPDRRLRIDSELGTLQFYSSADLINNFSDRTPVKALLDKPHSRIAATLLRWNFADLHIDDFSQLRYEFTVCRADATPEAAWTTATPSNGEHHWCLYKLRP